MVRFTDCSHVASCENHTFENVQKIAVQGVYEKKAGCLKFYEALTKTVMGIKDYPHNKSGRLDVCPESMSLQKYSVLPFEPLHDWKGY